MRLREIMTERPESISPEQPVARARAAMRRAGIHHLVVVEGREVTGVISDRDIRNVGGQVAVREVMSTKVAVAGPNTTVREAANILRGRSVGSLPVMDRGRLVGIVTISDLLTLIGQGAERPVAASRRWTLHRRGPRRRAPEADLAKNA
jgi:acetoin utilization protein AcuB